MNEWNIQSRAHACEACGQPFADKQPYRTMLFEDGKELRRSDICEPCAQKNGDSRTQTGFISHWQGVFEMPPPVTEAIQKDTAETLLRKLVEQNDPQHAPAAYILAVMLERKRLLKHRDTVTDDQGNELLIYEHAQSGESFTVPDPHLRLDQLSAVQEQIAELLAPGKKTAAEPVADPAAETASN